jgi:putative kinase
MSPIKLPDMMLDGTSTPLEVDGDEIDRFYLPLARNLLNRLIDHPRCLVGIGGPPACGKSAFSQLLAAVVNALNSQDQQGDEGLAPTAPISIQVGLDGWHYPNSYLDTHFILRGGAEISLRKVKGSPASFNALELLDFLQRLRQGRNPVYPLYSRVFHDPQPTGQILASHRLILVEGNYLLLNAPPWNTIRELFDLTLFLTAPREILLKALYDRHLRGGKLPEDIQSHMAFSDVPNLDLILSNSHPADILIRKSDSRRVLEIIYP